MKNPFLEDEKEIMDLLVEAYNKFVKLEQTHPTHNREFTDGIHKCQDILGHRILQRDYSEYYPTYKK